MKRGDAVLFEKFHLNRIEYGDHVVSEIEDNISDADGEDFDFIELPAFFHDAFINLQGVTYTLPYRPVTAMAMENLLYLQTFSYWEARSSFVTERLFLSSYLLSYTYAGEGDLKYGGSSYPLREGECFLIDCRKPHSYRTTKAVWKHVEIHFAGASSSYIYEQFSATKVVAFPIFDKEWFHQQLEKLLTLYEAILPYRELQISNHIESILTTILCHTNTYEKAARQVPDNLKYLVTYMEKNYMKSMSLEFLSEFSSISKFHLCRIFKKYLGFSPYEYLIWLRMEHAKQILQSTCLPANKVGIIVGISDENYFYRIFKKRTGMSPKEFREMIK